LKNIEQRLHELGEASRAKTAAGVRATGEVRRAVRRRQMLIPGLGLALVAALGFLFIPRLMSDDARHPVAATSIRSYEGSWKLISGRDAQGDMSLLEGHPVTLVLEEGRASGSSSCNSYWLDVDIGVRTFATHGYGGFITQVGCSGDVEQRYMAALRVADSIGLDGEELVIGGPQVELVFAPAPALADKNETSEPAESATPVAEAHLITPRAGWALTNGGDLYFTNNTGDSWRDVSPAPDVQNAYFLDDKAGWATTFKATNSNVAFTLYSTTDAGRHWRSSPIGAPDILSELHGPGSIEFVDVLHGWIALQRTSGSAFSLGTLFITSDGGETWKYREMPDYGEITFLDRFTGWLVGGVFNDHLSVTNDGGLTWFTEHIPPPEDLAPQGRMTFGAPASFGFEAVLPVTYSHKGADRFVFYFSSDISTWAPYGSSTPVHSDADSGLAALTDAELSEPWFELDRDGSDLLVQTRKHARHVTPQGLPTAPLDAVDFVNSSTGFAHAENTTCTNGSDCVRHTWLMRTTDGGATWEPLSI
jgi:photosystem II stability/assembly factor-like uncharacterized protein